MTNILSNSVKAKIEENCINQYSYVRVVLNQKIAIFECMKKELRNSNQKRKIWSLIEYKQVDEVKKQYTGSYGTIVKIYITDKQLEEKLMEEEEEWYNKNNFHLVKRYNIEKGEWEFVDSRNSKRKEEKYDS